MERTFMLIALLFLFVGLYFTLKFRFYQLRSFKYCFQHTLGSLFTAKHKLSHSDSTSISPYQSMCTVLAGTLGVGNISGVAIALSLGGPGAIFWMLVSAFFGMMTAFIENYYGCIYRISHKESFRGGAMLYMEYGLGNKFLAIFFSLATILVSFGMGNMAQSKEIVIGIQDMFSISTSKSSFILMLLLSTIIIGGIKRIVKITELFVPFMALIYLSTSIFAIYMHKDQLLPMIQLIVTEAFQVSSATAGVAGFTLSHCLRQGIQRGIFSNEAGLGSSIYAHSASCNTSPVSQGLWSIMEVFLDTFIVCSITALAILTSGVYDMSQYATYADTMLPDHLLSGSSLTAEAFSKTYGDIGHHLISVLIICFAFSSILAWSYYGERAWTYLFGNTSIPFFRILFLACTFLGGNISLALITDFSDFSNILMAIPNLLALFLLIQKKPITL